MSTITRMWLGFAALCAGIIHLALSGSSPIPIATLFAVLGGAEGVWGIATFIRPRLALPRVVFALSLFPVLLWGALTAAASVSHNPAVASFLGFDSMALASLLDLFVSMVLAVAIRRRPDFSEPKRAISAPRYLIGVLVGGFVAAIIVTPALSATDAGKYATPMDGMLGMHMGAGTSLVLSPSH
jgi:hypothetical protein